MIFVFGFQQFYYNMSRYILIFCVSRSNRIRGNVFHSFWEVYRHYFLTYLCCHLPPPPPESPFKCMLDLPSLLPSPCFSLDIRFFNKCRNIYQREDSKQKLRQDSLWKFHLPSRTWFWNFSSVPYSVLFLQLWNFFLVPYSNLLISSLRSQQ